MVLALRLRRRRHLAGLPIPRSSCAARRFSAAVTTSLRRFSADAGEDKMTLEVSKANLAWRLEQSQTQVQRCGSKHMVVRTGQGVGKNVWLHERVSSAGSAYTLQPIFRR